MKHANDMTVPRRVLIVDDSPAIRAVLAHALSNDPRLEVVGEASDAYEARGLIKSLNPDVITLDVEMPRMSGLDFLERLMRLRPMPVVMFSSVTQAGSDNAVRALSLGAFDVLPKPLSGISKADLLSLRDAVASAVVNNASSKRDTWQPSKGTPVAHSVPDMARKWGGEVILIGASTGGVAAVEKVLSTMPRNAPPIVLSQHMPEAFLSSFCGRLAQIFPHDVQLAADGLELKPGNVYVSPGGALHTGVALRGAKVYCSLIDKPKRNGHCPSVDELFFSAQEFASRVHAVILTGLGRDGAEGMKALHDGGANCVAQDRESCVVYGMPRAAVEIGAVDAQVPLEEISSLVCQPVRAKL
ncbi:MAG: protein-glutamate methylesterase/protein-glutamine glutaminase [Paracoccaceae bacterium]